MLHELNCPARSKFTNMQVGYLYLSNNIDIIKPVYSNLIVKTIGVMPISDLKYSLKGISFIC